MNGPRHLPSKAHKPIAGYLWGVLIALICLCHSPILTIALAGTTAGAFIGEYWGVAALTLIDLFILSVTRLLRAFKGRSWPLPSQPRVGNFEPRYRSGGVPS